MRVKITKASGNGYWYRSYIGEIFEVTGTMDEDGDYQVVSSSKLIASKDCEEVKEMPKFNVGDTVKITQKGHSKRGKVGEIIATTGYDDRPWRVSFNGVPGDVFGDDEMELVVEDPLTPKFNIGSKIIVRDGTEDDGRTGIIIAAATVYPWRIRYDSDGETELFVEGELELVVDSQWMSKEAALKLCIDGAKITTDFGNPHEGSHMYFDGRVFIWKYGVTGNTEKAMGMLDAKRWKLWTPPTPPKPKFSKDTFVIDECEDYGRIVSMEYEDGSWVYQLSDSVGNDCLWECDEDNITKA